MKKTDICIIGAGPAGIFTALELLRQNSKKRIVIVEKGKPVEKRKCPKAETKECINCRPYCNITTGFSGAGAFSDGKLSLSYEVGGDLPSLIGEEFAQEMIRCRYQSGGRRKRGRGAGYPQARHSGRLKAGGLSHPASWHGESPGDLL